MAFKYTPKAERYPEPGKLESAARNLVGGAANVVGLVGQGAGHLGSSAADAGFLPNPFGLTQNWFKLTHDLGSALSDWGQNLQRPAQLAPTWEDKGFFDRVTNWDYWKDPRGFIADAFSGLGSSLPFMGVGLGARALGAVLPTRRIASSGLEWLAQNGGNFGHRVNLFARTGLGKALGETADAGLNYAATVAPLDALTNAAEIIKPLKERGFNDNEISRLMLGSMAHELPYDMLDNFITGNTILGKGFGLKGRTWKGRLGYGSLNIPLEMASEYMQEGAQTGSTLKYQGYNFTDSPFWNLLTTGNMFETPEEQSAGAAGAIGGVLPAAGGALHRTVTGKDEPKPPQPTTSDAAALREWIRNNPSGWNVPNSNVADTIIRAAEKYGIPPKYALAMAAIESHGDQNDVSKAGAIGVMQLMPATARGLGVDPYDEEQNIDGGVRMMKELYDKYKKWGRGEQETWDLVFAAYNAGGGYVDKYNGVPPFNETINHVARGKKVLSYAPDYQSEQPQAQPQSSNDTQGSADIYVGESGKGEGRYWQKQGDWVSFKGAQPDLLNAVDMLGKWFFDKTGKRLVVTAGTNGDHPSNGTAHGHDAGWKVDVNDWYGVSDGYLVTRDGTKGSLTNEFIAYGRSLGLGMNWEGDHIDIALDGTQWDGNGEHAGGFNPRNGATRADSGEESYENTYDTSGFTPRQIEIWGWAQYASKRAKDKWGIRLAPELIFKQWQLEDGGDFIHPTRNWGGLKDIHENFRSFNSDQEYADAYVDDFIRRYHELNDAADENGMMDDKTFTDIMLKVGYITQGDYQVYINGLPNKKAPTLTGRRKVSGNKRSGAPADGDSTAEPAKAETFDDVIAALLNDDNNAKFNINAHDEDTQKIFGDFATSKRDSVTGEAALKLQAMLNTDGEFEPTRNNLRTLRELLGNELQTFGQGKTSERWNEMLFRQMQPGFIGSLNEDDKRFFGNTLLNKMKDAGIDLKTIPAATKQKILEGDEKAFVNAWQAIQDRLSKSTEAEPLVSDRTKKALDDIANRVAELRQNPSAENAQQQIQGYSKLYQDITKLTGELNKLTADRDKAAQTKGTQAAQVDAAGKVAKYDADIQKKQADIDAKIDSFYNPPQPVKVEPSKYFAPVKTQADNALPNSIKKLNRSGRRA